jgi:hypothetical protein
VIDAPLELAFTTRHGGERLLCGFTPTGSTDQRSTVHEPST